MGAGDVSSEVGDTCPAELTLSYENEFFFTFSATGILHINKLCTSNDKKGNTSGEHD